MHGVFLNEILSVALRASYVVSCLSPCQLTVCVVPNPPFLLYVQ